MRVAAELRLFLKPAHRDGTIQVGCDGISSLGHVVQSLGVPLTEVGQLTVNGRPVTPAYRPGGGDVVEVAAVARPQPVPTARFLLDVHLGALARRLRLAGVDTAYANDADDDTLIGQANTERRILLTQDRGLLRRRALWLGAYVRGAHPDTQLADVLDRFAPPLAPWTRCTACNGPLRAVPKAEVEPLLQPGTRLLGLGVMRLAGNRGLRVRCSGIRSALSILASAGLYATRPVRVPPAARQCRGVPRHPSKQRANRLAVDLGIGLRQCWAHFIAPDAS